MDRMGPLSILSLKGPVTADTMLNFDGDYHGHWHNDATCEQTLRSNTSSCMTFAGQTSSLKITMLVTCGDILLKKGSLNTL